MHRHVNKSMKQRGGEILTFCPPAGTETGAREYTKPLYCFPKPHSAYISAPLRCTAVTQRIIPCIQGSAANPLRYPADSIHKPSTPLTL